jgi:hypothetical protein
MSVTALADPRHLAPETLPRRFYQAELIPADETTMDCCFGMADCRTRATVWVTCDMSLLRRKPLCPLHANFNFAEWLAAI